MSNTALSKRCSDCNEQKELSQFHSDKGAPFGKAYHCKECANLRSRIWHSKRENLDKRNKRVVERIKEIKGRIVKQLGDKCQKCGNSFPLCVYDFHHIDPTEKDFNIGDVLKFNPKRAEEEIKKCLLLCSNCHRILHGEN